MQVKSAINHISEEKKRALSKLNWKLELNVK